MPAPLLNRHNAAISPTPVRTTPVKVSSQKTKAPARGADPAPRVDRPRDAHQVEGAGDLPNLVIHALPRSAAQQPLPLQPATPAPADRPPAARAYEPWGWSAVVRPHFGTQAKQRFV